MRGFRQAKALCLAQQINNVLEAFQELYETEYQLIDTARLEKTGKRRAMWPSKPWSIIVSDPLNPVHLLDEQEDDASEKASIGNLRIGSDFIVTKERRVIPSFYNPRSRLQPNLQKKFVFKINLPDLDRGKKV